MLSALVEIAAQDPINSATTTARAPTVIGDNLFPCALQLIGERACIVNFSKRFDDRGGINRHGARLRVGVSAIGTERLNVTVENNADEFICFVHHRTAAVAADDVGVGNEI